LRKDPEDEVSLRSRSALPIEPVRFVRDRLLILDQRLLPDRERYLVCRTVSQVVEAIRTLAVRGAPLIGVAAAYGLALEKKDRPGAARALIAARPTAVNLAWAVKRALRSQDVLGEARRIHQEDARMCEAIARHGAPLFRRKRAITICNTGALATGGIGTAFGVLARARARIFALETRPLRQGSRLTMWEAEKLGLRATLVTDGAAAATLREKKIQAAIVGADRIARNGDTANKIGTYGLAILCRELGVPFYVAAPRSTFDPSTPNGAGIPIEERSPREVSERFPAYNPAFDVTPARYIAAFITERGILKPGELRSGK
jgi:methylthioribose-1-phosphate isomerase